jgi:hypothetical protein
VLDLKSPSNIVEANFTLKGAAPLWGVFESAAPPRPSGRGFRRAKERMNFSSWSTPISLGGVNDFRFCGVPF